MLQTLITESVSKRIKQIGSERVWLSPEMRADFLKSCGQQSGSVKKEEKNRWIRWEREVEGWRRA